MIAIKPKPNNKDISNEKIDMIFPNFFASKEELNMIFDIVEMSLVHAGWCKKGDDDPGCDYCD